MRNQALWIIYLITAISILALAWGGSKAVTVFSESKPPDREVCLIIDAGHGGVDGGAVSCTGIPESSYNLEIALRLNDLFRFLGYETQMIRAKDVSVYTKGETIAQKKISDLKERVRIINDEENAVLISIHQNYYPDSQYRGAQVFYSKSIESRIFAENLQALLKETINPGSRRESKKGDGIYLLDHISKPGILVECGFLSNPYEERLLRTPEYQKKLCCVIVSAADRYLSNT